MSNSRNLLYQRLSEHSLSEYNTPEFYYINVVQSPLQLASFLQSMLHKLLLVGYYTIMKEATACGGSHIDFTNV